MLRELLTVSEERLRRPNDPRIDQVGASTASKESVERHAAARAAQQGERNRAPEGHDVRLGQWLAL